MTTARAALGSLARKHVGGTAVVLIYHRVAELERDPQLLAVSPGNFDAQVRLLAERYRTISLEDLLDGLGHRKVPDRSVAITFDDGYADNLTTAEPILSAHGVPATVFACSGYVESGREFWWDELERLLLHASELPEAISIAVEGQRFEASLAQGVCSPDAAGRPSTWNVLEPTPDPRHSAYLGLCDFVRPLSAKSRAEALRQVREATNAADTVRESHRPLTAEQLRILDNSKVVEVGAHTVNHVLLAARPIAEQREEILADKVALGRILGRETTTFSYPYGGLEDYSDESVDVVRQADFVGACSNHLGVVKPWTNPFRLPRVVVRDVDSAAFAALLGGCFHESR